MSDNVDGSQENTQISDFQIKGAWQLGQKSALKHNSRSINNNTSSLDASPFSFPLPVKQSYYRDSQDTVCNTNSSQISSPLVIKQKSSQSQHFSPYKLPPLYLNSRITPLKRRIQTLPDEDINQQQQNSDEYIPQDQHQQQQLQQQDQIRNISRTSNVMFRSYNTNEVVSQANNNKNNNRSSLKVISQSMSSGGNSITKRKILRSNSNVQNGRNYQNDQKKSIINRSSINISQNNNIKSRQTSRNRIRCISQDSSNNFLTAQDKQAQINHIAQVSRNDEQLCQVVQNNLSCVLQSKSTSVEQKMDKVKVETKKMEDIAQREVQLLQIQPENNNVRSLISHIYLETISAKIAVLIQAMERNKRVQEKMGRQVEGIQQVKEKKRYYTEQSQQQQQYEQQYQSPNKQQQQHSQQRLVSFNLKDNKDLQDNNNNNNNQLEDKSVFVMNSYNYNHIRRSPFKH